jgi:hypothetical protein
MDACIYLCFAASIYDSLHLFMPHLRGGLRLILSEYMSDYGPLLAESLRTSSPPEARDPLLD